MKIKEGSGFLLTKACPLSLEDQTSHQMENCFYYQLDNGRNQTNQLLNTALFYIVKTSWINQL